MEIVLPLGISFFTFQQIAYLVDVYREQGPRYRFVDYAAFVSFFPQLIAGPIVHHRHFISQLGLDRMCGFNWSNLVIGVSIFTIGLFKKVAIADGFAVIANKVFGAAEQGLDVTFADAWLGAIAYTFQIYFDFSGYGDMALGLAAMIGLSLPINFNSPYKSRSIIEFWQRWHMTLSAFLKNYLYIPLGGNRYGSWMKYRNLAIVMLLGGLWHGASWSFVIWVGLHGCYLIINHGWRRLVPSTKAGMFARVINAGYWLITMIAVVFAWVFFRAESLEAATSLSRSMLAFNSQWQLVVPASVVALAGKFGLTLGDHWFFVGGLFATVHVPDTHYQFLVYGIWLAIGIVVVLPNTAQLFGRYEKQVPVETNPFGDWVMMHWRPNLWWGMFVGILLTVSVLMLSQVTEFIYFNF